jgi:hypothetical protein
MFSYNRELEQEETALKKAESELGFTLQDAAKLFNKSGNIDEADAYLKGSGSHYVGYPNGLVGWHNAFVEERHRQIRYITRRIEGLKRYSPNFDELLKTQGYALNSKTMGRITFNIDFDYDFSMFMRASISYDGLDLPFMFNGDAEYSPSMDYNESIVIEPGMEYKLNIVENDMISRIEKALKRFPSYFGV